MATILLFERNIHARIMLTRYLEIEAHRVEFDNTVNGLHLSLLGEHLSRPPQHYDLILLSHHKSAPHTETGLAAYETIRAIPAYRHTPVFGTSYDNYPWRQAARDPNFAFLPWRIEESDGGPVWNFDELGQNLLQFKL